MNVRVIASRPTPPARRRSPPPPRCPPAARAARAAAREILAPQRDALSRPSNPPSGPIIIASGGLGDGILSSVLSASGSRTMPVPCHAESHSARHRGAATSGIRLRPDCSAAAVATCRQWATRLSALASSGSGALRAVTSGWIAVTPSSVALRTAESIASLATIACARVSANGDSRSTGRNRSTRTAAPRLSARTSVAAYSPPVPSNNRQRVADGEPQDARRVVRRPLRRARSFAPRARVRAQGSEMNRGAAITACSR